MKFGNYRMIGRGVVMMLLLMTSLNVFSQKWEEVRDSEDYIYGEGWGSTVAEAERQALANLIGKIATNVTGESHSSLKTQNSNGKLDEESQFSQTVNTYSQATLTNTQQKVLKNEPDAYVVRWIKKSEIEKIFESRKRKAIDLVETAIRAEKKGKVDDVLRNYYWALTLLKSLQYPNEVTYTDEDGKEHVLTNWCKEKIDDTFYELKTVYDSRDGNDIRLAITYKGKPVNSVDYKFWDGQTWSAIYSAKDGWGVLELAPGYDGSQVQLKYEFEYAGEAKVDPEVEMVLNAVKGTPMPKSYINVMLKTNEKAKEKKARMEQMASAGSFTTNSVESLPSPRRWTKVPMPIRRRWRWWSRPLRARITTRCASSSPMVDGTCSPSWCSMARVRCSTPTISVSSTTTAVCWYVACACRSRLLRVSGSRSSKTSSSHSTLSV